MAGPVVERDSEEQPMRFMVSFAYRDGVSGEDIQALVPEEQARVKALREEGVVEELYLAADRSRGWFVMQGESEEAVEQATASLPLSRFWDVSNTPIFDAQPA
jgi:muconolactone delta-isomerase